MPEGLMYDQNGQAYIYAPDQGQYVPYTEGGFGKNALLETEALVLGGKQILGTATPEEAGRLSEIRQEQEMMRPSFGNFAGQMVPGVVAGTAGALAGTAAAPALGFGALTGALVGGGVADAAIGAATTPDTPFQGAAIGAGAGLAGVGLSAAAGRGIALASRVGSNMMPSGASARVSGAIDDMMEPRLYTETGAAGRAAQAVMESNWATGTLTGAFRRQTARQNWLKESAAREIGLDMAADDFGRAAIQGQVERLGQAIGDVHEAIRITPEAQMELSAKLAQIQETYSADGLQKNMSVARLARDINTSRPEGRAMRDAQRKAGDMEWNASGGQGRVRDQSKAEGARAIKQALDEAMEKSMGQEMIDQWKTLNAQYRKAKVLQKPGVVSESDDLNMTSYLRNMRREFGERQMEASGVYRDMRTLAGQQSNLPDSGTALRQSLGQAVTGLGLLGGYGALN